MARTPLHMYDMEYEIDEYLGLIASGEHDVNAQDADGKTPCITQPSKDSLRSP